jgi:catalase
MAPGLVDAISIRARRVAALAADGVEGDALAAVARALAARGANVQVVAPRPGTIAAADGSRCDMSLITTRSLAFDAVFVPGGERSVRDLKWDPRAWVFLTEACERGKAILAVGLGVRLFELDDAGTEEDDRLGVRAERGLVLARGGVCEAATRAFIAAIAGQGMARARRAPALAVALL